RVWAATARWIAERCMLSEPRLFPAALYIPEQAQFLAQSFWYGEPLFEASVPGEPDAPRTVVSVQQRIVPVRRYRDDRSAKPAVGTSESDFAVSCAESAPFRARGGVPAAAP